MTLWFVLGLMTMAAVFAVLWPLGRRQARAPSGSDVAVYRDQLAELERDRAAGLIGEGEAQAARVEISRRLIAAADAAAAAAPVSAGTPWRRGVAAAALVLLPLSAAGLYLALGSPYLRDGTRASRDAPLQEQPIDNLVAQVERHLENNPNDGRGWEVVAPVYMRLGRFADAVRARRQSLVLNGETAERQADLGEALVAAANGIVTAESKTAFERAVALDAQIAKARFFLGMAAEQDGRREDAARIWRGMIADAPDAPWSAMVRRALASVEETPPASGAPSAEDVAAAAQLSEGERSEMVRGMVARLADRLAADGSDIDGWLRLVRAYVVLGEQDKARAAAADARKAIGSDSEKVRRLDDLVRSLGLAG
jgi:cytochrome c-type biogenesis protein CcmH